MQTEYLNGLWYLEHMDHPSLQALSNIQLLSDFDQDSLIQIQNGSQTKSYPAGTIVLWENEVSPGIHLVRNGWLKAIRTTTTGREQVISLFGPGDSFSVTSAFTDIPNPARMVSLEEALVQIIPRDLMFTLIDQHPDLSLKLIQRLSKSLAHLISLVEDLSLESIETRLAKFLLSQARDGIYSRKKWETQDTISAQIGTVPDVLSRILRDFEKEGLITVDRKQIILLDIHALKEKASINN